MPKLLFSVRAFRGALAVSLCILAPATALAQATVERERSRNEFGPGPSPTVCSGDIAELDFGYQDTRVLLVVTDVDAFQRSVHWLGRAMGEVTSTDDPYRLHFGGHEYFVELPNGLQLYTFVQRYHEVIPGPADDYHLLDVMRFISTPSGNARDVMQGFLVCR